MFNVNWIDILLIILASFRLTHLIVYDQITEFIRRPFLSVTIIENSNGQLEEHLEIKGTGIRHFIGSLLSCYWCTGIWSSTFVVIFYFSFPITFPIFLILAVAGAAAIIESKI